MYKKISIHDIARQLNVSSATVSYVLNGKAQEKRISAVQEKRILAFARQAGYRPNMVAKSLRTGKSKTIGMLVEDIADPFFSSIAREVEKIASRLDYKIFYSSTENDTRITQALIKVFRDAQVDGYIIAPAPGIEQEVKALIDDHLPVILFDRYFPGLPTVNVVVDNFNGAYQATRHMLEQGSRHIGFVTLDSTQVQMSDRLAGYTAALQEAGIQLRVLKIPYRLHPDKIAEKVKLFIKKNKDMNGVLFATNYLAISGLDAINNLHKKVPADMAIVGFDDNTHFSLFSPAITAVAQPMQEISEQVMKKLIACMADTADISRASTVVLPTRLIIRESSLRTNSKKYSSS
ncbi:substrate-binding domain-containing protein [Chitinophaga sp. CC14]|uniref:LacI family DNA-binding transcriptional regulator n=1 Tax=Chitinophaga sp. CC14 TaxID=3029199 RepID=UPI003B7DCE8C